MDLLNDCVLEDQMVVEEKSKTIKSIIKTIIDEFMNSYEKIMKEKGHYNDDGKLDSSMKAYHRRFYKAWKV